MKVALTFDAENIDRSGDGTTAVLILDALEAAGVPATFFLQGPWVQKFAPLAQRIARSGHLIGSHGWAHQHWTQLLPYPQDAFADDVLRAEEIIEATTGQNPMPFYRAPFGETHAVMRRTLEDLGYKDIGWNVDSDDWREALVLETVGARAQGYLWSPIIALFHAWSPDTARDLPHVITDLQRRFAEFVTVADL